MLKFKWESKFKKTEIGFEIPSEWEEKMLGDVATVESGGRAPQAVKYFVNGKYPFIRVKHLNSDKYLHDYDLITEQALKDYSLKLYKKGTIVFPRSGESINLGKYNTVPFDSYIVNHLAIVRGKAEVANTEFLYYVLVAYDKISKEEIAGTSLPYFKTSDIKKRKVICPIPFEQSSISTVLSRFDELIENKKKQNEILEKTAMAIFKSWFIDFEPFKDGEFVDSELGRIPKGWEVRSIGKTAEIRNGLSYSGKEKFEEPVEGSYVFITLNNAIEGGGFKPVYTWIKSDRIKKHHFLEEGDLIIPNTEQTKDERLLGSPGIVFFPEYYEREKGVYSHHITKISPVDQKLKLFLYLFLRFTREDSASFATGTGVLGMDIGNFKRNKLVITPPKPILEKFHSNVESFFKKIIINQKQIMVLRKVRDALLPLLIFGKLRVENI